MPAMAIDPKQWRIGLVGYGEVGRILAEDLGARGVAISAYDLKLDGVQSLTLREHAAAHRVTMAVSHAELAAHADLIVSAVTASQTVPVAQAVAPMIRGGAFFLDFNSASPGAKQRAATLIEGAGGRYVEGAVMTAISPCRIKAPLLLGGPWATELAPLINELGFAAHVASDQAGVASATKMCRSVMIKGMEAMVIESFTAARHYGVEDALVASLHENFPGLDWEKQAAYFFQRVIEHGRRRSEEAREVAETIRDAGLTPWSALGAAERHAFVADLADAGVFGARETADFARSPDWRTEADRILASARAVRRVAVAEPQGITPGPSTTVRVDKPGVPASGEEA